MALNVYSRRCAGQSRVLSRNVPALTFHARASQVAYVAGDDFQSQAVEEGYSAAQNAKYWETRPVAIISRLISIGSELVRWRISTSLSGNPSASGPPLLLDSLCRLGPAFVKIGQALSSRPDILPPSYTAELEKLQDRIPPFSTDEAMRVIENELGQKVGDVFSSISTSPVAAASIGQVYKAVLRSSGQVVAIKVQRPGVVELIAKDCYILRYLAFALRRIAKLNTDLPSLVDEWATSLFKELDYRREGANAEKFKLMFARIPEIYVPSIYNNLTTTGVITMEWIEGEKLRTASRRWGDDVATATLADGSSKLGSPADLRLVEVGVRCSLEQILEECYYHADPHPGNLLKLADGRLCYLDFGMMGSIDLKVRDALLRATLHLVNREYDKLADDFVALGFLPPGSDRSKVIPALTSVFQVALSQGVNNLSFGDLAGNLGRTMYQFKFAIPSYFTLLVRSLTVLEGIALASDPNYKVLNAAYPWVARRLLTDKSPELKETLRGLLYKQDVTDPSSEPRFIFERLEALLIQAAKVKQLGTMNPQAAPSSSGTSSLPSSSPLKLLLRAEGDFIRDILLDEMVKGIDAGIRLSVDLALHPDARIRQPALSMFPMFSSFSSVTTSRDRNSASVEAQVSLSAYRMDNLGNNQSQGWGLIFNPVISTIGGLFELVPRLSTALDEDQVQGLLGLANALYSLSKSSSSKADVESSLSPSTLPPQLASLPFPLIISAETAEDMRQAALGLEWLARELTTLSREEQIVALQIPIEITTRLASRVTARGLRSFLAREQTVLPAIKSV